MRSSFISVVLGVFAAIIGGVGLVFIVVDSMKDKPGALAIVIFLILAIVIIFALFSIFMANRRPPRSESMERFNRARNQFNAIDGHQRALSSGYSQPDELVSVESGVMVREKQIRRAADAVVRQMMPSVPPTRRNIMRVFPQMQSAGFVSQVQNDLRERGFVRGGGHGREFEWVEGSGDDGEYEGTGE